MMSNSEIILQVSSLGPRAGARRVLLPLFAAIALVGAAAFVAGILGGEPQRAWQAYLINFVFWTGLAFGAVLFSVMLTLTNARWGRPLKRLAESFGAYLPVAFLLFWVLYFGKERIFPWIHEPIPVKAAWLNSGFLFARDGVALFALTAVSLALIYLSVRRDLDAIAGRTVSEPTQRKREGRIVTLSVIYGILFAFLLSLLAFDLIMSLSPHWYSTLFGAYYWMGSFYTGLAGILILSAIAVKTMGMEEFIGAGQFHDLGKLLFGFCVVTGDFFYAQFLVQWYGNLPEETEFLIHRIRMSPWQPIAWGVLIVCYAFPFVVLLRRSIKMKPVIMMVLCTIILAGMWVERFLLVAPSIWHGEYLPLGITEILITGGFLGIVSLCVLIFLQAFPVLPVADPLFQEQLKRAKSEGHA